MNITVAVDSKLIFFSDRNFLCTNCVWWLDIVTKSMLAKKIGKVTSGHRIFHHLKVGSSVYINLHFVLSVRNRCVYTVLQTSVLSQQKYSILGHCTTDGHERLMAFWRFYLIFWIPKTSIFATDSQLHLQLISICLCNNLFFCKFSPTNCPYQVFQG